MAFVEPVHSPLPAFPCVYSIIMTKAHLLLQAAAWALVATSAHAFISSSATPSGTTTTSLNAIHASSSRRSALQDMAKRIAVASGIVASSPLVGPNSAMAETATDAPVEMKLFSDELFVVNIPKRFFALRRRAKGDLPDEKTGQGRRGSSIFSAGDMAKAEVIAIERFPVRVLLEEAGVSADAIANADLSTIQKLGAAETIAELLALRRDKDKPGSANRSVVQKDSVKVSEDGKTLTFALRAQIDVQKPEELFKQQGIYELYRDTLCKATLESGLAQSISVQGHAGE